MYLCPTDELEKSVLRVVIFGAGSLVGNLLSVTGPKGVVTWAVTGLVRKLLASTSMRAPNFWTREAVMVRGARSRSLSWARCIRAWVLVPFKGGAIPDGTVDPRSGLNLGLGAVLDLGIVNAG